MPGELLPLVMNIYFVQNPTEAGINLFWLHLDVAEEDIQGPNSDAEPTSTLNKHEVLRVGRCKGSSHVSACK